MDFTGKHIVITGASAGIGKATAARIIKGGGHVTLIARRRDVLEATCRDFDERAVPVVADAEKKRRLSPRSTPLCGVRRLMGSFSTPRQRARSRRSANIPTRHSRKRCASMCRDRSGRSVTSRRT